MLNLLKNFNFEGTFAHKVKITYMDKKGKVLKEVIEFVDINSFESALTWYSRNITPYSAKVELILICRV